MKKLMNVFWNVLLGMLGGVFAFVVMYLCMHKSPSLCSVNVNLIVDDFIKTMAKSNIPANELEQSTGHYMKQLQAEIAKIAKERQTILFLSEAVVSGALDVTAIVKSRTDKNYQQESNNVSKGSKDEKQ